MYSYIDRDPLRGILGTWWAGKYCHLLSHLSETLLALLPIVRAILLVPSSQERLHHPMQGKALPYLTTSFEKVCYFGHGHKVGDMRFACSGCSPVYLQLTLLQDRLQFIFTKNFLQGKERQIQNLCQTRQFSKRQGPRKLDSLGLERKLKGPKAQLLSPKQNEVCESRAPIYCGRG